MTPPLHQSWSRGHAGLSLNAPRRIDRLISHSRFFGVRRSLKYVQSGHHAAGSKLVVPAIGRTSR